MHPDISNIFQILHNTPQVIDKLLYQLDDTITNSNEGEYTWTAREVVAHLIVCEETNWLPRIKIIVHQTELLFSPIDMEAHFTMAKRFTLSNLILKFTILRRLSLQELKGMQLQANDYFKTGLHPVAGTIKLQELLATWATHDLTHIAQIARVLARQHTQQVGNFRQFLKILN
ncbi:MAG TPA: DinB family protein [Phnomibacter sp.]|nr:DinB family protein [Phnomibacter sp.]